MSGIKFEDIINFYPKHNRSIFGKIVEAQKSGSLIPFVGAGMSVFCGYKLWGTVLRELAEFIPTEDVHQAVLEQIDSGAYVEAAQMILEAYPVMLDQLPELISPNKIDDCPPEKFRASAAYVLPQLFQKGLVMTTNFDRVLEAAYLRWNHKAIQTVTPNQQDRLAQLRQNQSLGLFKLHGDIGSGTVSIDDLVFTKEQYEKKYADGSPLVQELTRWFENRRLLFLGCSLNKDRTMEVLKRVTQAQPGIRHYAILGCKGSDVSTRLKELTDIGILPVFYDDKNHDAVRVILERLLEETDQSAYKKLWEVSREVSATTKEEHRLLFDSDYFPFTGRKQELESLEAFCDSEERISWWAVTGPGGMGKSRLVYEFTNQKRKDGWQIERFEAHPSKDSHANSIEALNEWTPLVPSTIVVLDDVQGYMSLVRQWLNTVVRRLRSEKLRVLLLEREGENLSSSSWLGTGSCDDIPTDWCYDENFLHLEPMNDAELITIMDEYAAATGQTLNAELLLKTLERVDPGLKRPMYAIAIADACCQGKDPTHWDRKRVLDTLLDRELNFHFNRFRGMAGKGATKTLRSELKDLLAHSCVRGILLLDDIRLESYPKLNNKINDLDMSIPEFLEGLGVLRTVLFHSIRVDQSGKPIGEPLEERQKKVVALSCPDLIKEHLVLNLAFEDGKRELLFPQGWEENPGQLSFLNRLLADYSDRLKERADYWDTIFQAILQKLLPAKIYGHILLGYTAFYSDERVAVAIDRLARLYDEMGRAPEIAVEYGGGLFNRTIGQGLGLCTEATAKLDKLYQSHPDIPELAVQLAKGLLNLTAEQDCEDCAETVMRLNKLYQSHPDIPELAVQLAKGLINLTVEQDCEDCAKTVMRLDKLYQSHPDIPELAVLLAEGLFNLTVKQDREDCAKTVMRLDKLYQSHPDIPELAVQFAKGLFNLTVEQEPEDCAETIKRLDKLYQSHPDIPELAVRFAKGLFNLTVEQEPEDRAETIMRLDKLYQSHPDIPELAVLLAKELVNLTVEQDCGDCAETVMRLDKLYQSHLDISELAILLAKGLFNLTVEQEPEDCAETVMRLDRLYQSHPGVPELAVPFAKGLLNLTAHPGVEYCRENVARCERIYADHPNCEDVAVEFTGCLVNFSFQQKSEPEVRYTLARAKEVLERHPGSGSIQLHYAKTWFNLTLQQRDADIPATVADVGDFLQSHAGIISQFKEALAKYLSDHPDHTIRYQLLVDL